MGVGRDVAVNRPVPQEWHGFAKTLHLNEKCYRAKKPTVSRCDRWAFELLIVLNQALLIYSAAASSISSHSVRPTLPPDS
jgi:hypothetical protein